MSTTEAFLGNLTEMPVINVCYCFQIITKVMVLQNNISAWSRLRSSPLRDRRSLQRVQRCYTKEANCCYRLSVISCFSLYEERICREYRSWNIAMAAEDNWQTKLQTIFERTAFQQRDAKRREICGSCAEWRKRKYESDPSSQVCASNQ